MNKQDVTKFFKGIQTAVSRKSPEILVGIGIACMITSTVAAVKATPKALKLIDAKKKEEEKDELTKVEVVKAAWKPYVPAAVSGTVGVACLIGANSVHARRNAALATAYKLSETAFTEYKEQVVEAIGEKKEKVVREKVAQKKMDENPASRSEVIVAGPGGVYFLEPVSMRYFSSDMETVRKVINDLNYRMTCGMEEYISLSEFYDEVGLSHTKYSDDLGWNIGKDGPIRVTFPLAKTDDGKPCFELDFAVEPRRGYMDLM